MPLSNDANSQPSAPRTLSAHVVVSPEDPGHLEKSATTPVGPRKITSSLTVDTESLLYCQLVLPAG